MSGTAEKSSVRPAATLVVGVLLVGGSVVPGSAAAQSRPGPLSADAGLTTSTLGGSDFQNVGVGLGAGLGVQYRLTTRLSLGIAGQASWHETANLDGSLRLLGASLRPRYRLGGPGSGLRPFLGARLGVARWRASRSADTVSATVRADGLQAGAAAGVSYPLTETASVELAAIASYLGFGDARVDASLGGTELSPFTSEDSGTTGLLVGLRSLLRVRFP